MEQQSKMLNLIQQPSLIFWASKLNVTVDNLHNAILHTGSTNKDVIKSYIILRT
jgi:hypothetical protein